MTGVSRQPPYIARALGAFVASASPAYPGCLCRTGAAPTSALSGKGDIWIVEIKSEHRGLSLTRSGEYWDYCDRLFFAVSPAFPQTAATTQGSS